MKERRGEGREGERQSGREGVEQNTIVPDHSNEVYFIDLLPRGEGEGGSNTCLRVVIPVETLVMTGLNYQVEEGREGRRTYLLVFPLPLHLRQQRLVTSFFFFYLGSLYSDDRSS